MIDSTTRGPGAGRGSSRKATTLLAALLVLASGVRADVGADEGALGGQVRSLRGEPVGDALVTITELRWQATTDARGRFRFLHVPEGRYVLSVLSDRHGQAMQEVSVSAHEDVEIKIRLSLEDLQERVVVTANRDHRGIPTMDRPVSVLTERDLETRLAPTLGDTLTSLPGLNATSHAAGASRPVIRGFGGDRARILEGGLSVADASGTRSDNAVATDPDGVAGIEVLRGPAMLQYGSNVVGGVVNILDGRIPDRVPERRLGGSVALRARSVADERSDRLALDGGRHDLSWRLSALQRQSDDVSTPLGTLSNSDLDTEQASGGLSWMLGRGYAGIAHQGFETEYGIPTERGIRIDMKRRRWDATGEFPRSAGFFSGFKARLGYTDYEHAESITEGDFGSRYRQETWEARFEAPHRWWADRVDGRFGVQLWNRDLTVDGPESFLPASETRGLALFAIQELALGRFAVQLGSRWELVDADTTTRDRSFHGFSTSAGLSWDLDGPWEVGATLSRTTRVPTTEELFSDGPHLSTFQYEVGNPDLVEEHGSAVELHARRTEGRVTGELALFSADYDDYVFLIPTGNTIQVGGEEVPEFVTLQRDARYRGAEARVRVDLLHNAARQVQLELRGDTVRGETDRTATGRWLPKIPASRLAAGIRYDGRRIWGGVELVRVLEQDRVQLFEQPTDGYTMVNVHAGVRVYSQNVVHDVTAVIGNLTDELARNHISPLKEIAPLGGQDVSLRYKVQF